MQSLRGQKNPRAGKKNKHKNIIASDKLAFLMS